MISFTASGVNAYELVDGEVKAGACTVRLIDKDTVRIACEVIDVSAADFLYRAALNAAVRTGAAVILSEDGGFAAYGFKKNGGLYSAKAADINLGCNCKAEEK
ncbi:MAG: hypothetical protein LBS99_06575 [Clostridiales bacterium]|jgi:tRNA(Ile2) C34 agmatinyltransferase TiaS|nr:hypothetical protein [Clostridiales bacterium]